jgi:transcriptional regulator with PAS, ATPase and Fis domain
MSQQKRLGPKSIARRKAVAERCKEAFLKGQPCDFADLPEGVYQSWLRSKQLGVNPQMQALAPSSKQTKVRKEFSADIEFLDNRYSGINTRFSNLIASCGGASFHVDNRLVVNSSRGSKALLEEFAAKGLEPGSCLDEEHAGANAVSIAALVKADTLTVGPENYCDFFAGYVCYAVHCNFPGRRLKQPDYYSLIMVPLEQFSEAFIAACEFYSESVHESIRLSYQPQIKLQQSMVRANARATNTMTILVDRDDVIVDIDEDLCRLYDTYVDELRGKNAFEFMPDHAHLFSRVKAGETIQNYNYFCKAIPVDAEEHEFYMTLVPIYDEEKTPHEYIGFACTIMQAQHMRNHLTKLVSADAHFTFEDLLGHNEDFRLVKELALQAAQGTNNVLLYGENGTGKALFAQAIHNASPRQSKPFVTVNCAAIPKELISGELFGYFGDRRKRALREGSSGKLEHAHHGTLFLNEITELPLDVQELLVKGLDEKKVVRLGGDEYRNVDVRIIASLDRDPIECIKTGSLRLDLYSRLSVTRLDIPPLRERKDDIPMLAENNLRALCVTLDKDIHSITPQALDCLQAYNWPGNTRELRSVIERAVSISTEREISIYVLPNEIVNYDTTSTEALTSSYLHSKHRESRAFGSFEDLESERIKSAMKRLNGNKTLVAQELGIARATLYRKLNKIGDWS